MLSVVGSCLTILSMNPCDVRCHSPSAPQGWLLALVGWGLAFASAAPVACQVRQTDAARVLVIYDAAGPDRDGDGRSDSEEVALAYRAKRGVPADHLLALHGSRAGEYDYRGLHGWADFLSEVRDPVLQALARLGPLEIDTLLFCHGVPHQLSLPGNFGGPRSLDQALRAPHALGTPSAPGFPAMVFPSPWFEGSPGHLSLIHI